MQVATRIGEAENTSPESLPAAQPSRRVASERLPRGRMEIKAAPNMNMSWRAPDFLLLCKGPSAADPVLKSSTPKPHRGPTGALHLNPFRPSMSVY